MFKKLFSSPLLLRRLVKDLGRIATSLERIERAISFHTGAPSGTTEVLPDDEREPELLYSTDAASWERQERDKARKYRPPEEDE